MRATKLLYIIVFIIVLFVILPVISAAECDAITGSSSYVLFPMKVPHLGSPRVVPNPDYVTQTEQERKFTPKEPYSPFDNFRVVMDVSGLAGDGARVANFRARLIAEDDSGKEQIIWESAMHREKIDYSQQSDSGTFVADINGYPNGLGGEELIDAIAKNRKIFIRVERLCPFYEISEHISLRYAPLPENMRYEVVPNPDTQSGGWDEEYPTSVIADEKVDIPMQGRLTNCAQVYGRGEHKVVNMRGKSASLNPQQLLTIANNIFDEGFKKIDPFKTYIEDFSSYVDLANHDDNNWAMPIPDTIYLNYNKPKEVSSCGGGSQYFFINKRTWGGIAPWYSKVAYLHLDITDPVTAMHETGHSFCGLKDEYLGTFFQRLVFPTVSNCAVNPREQYFYNGQLYGDTFWKGCTRRGVHRPSKNSLMNTEVKHSVIDCGYCMAVIKGSSVRALWPECMTFDTVKPDCTKGRCPDKIICSPKDTNCANPNAFVCNTATKLCEYT